MSENEIVQFADVDLTGREKLAAICTDRQSGFEGICGFDENGKKQDEGRYSQASFGHR